MKVTSKKEKEPYVAPTAECYEVVSEKGFAGSIQTTSTAAKYDEVENVENWD